MIELNKVCAWSTSGLGFTQNPLEIPSVSSGLWQGHGRVGLPPVLQFGDQGQTTSVDLRTFHFTIDEPSEQHGLCRSLSYIIQTLSAERAFAVKLSTPIKVQVPAKWGVPGTAADFMINVRLRWILWTDADPNSQSIYSMVATTSGALNSLYPALVIALSNSAPYFKNLSVSASTRLIQLATAFSNPTFLLSDEGHPRLLFFM